MFRRIALLGVVGVVLMIGLFLDLRANGLAWQFFWSVTGEEEPLAQIRGVIEWVGNSIRPQPSFDPVVPVQHTNENPYGINTFLQLEPDPAKVEQQLRQISEIGFGWIRQEFPWEDIEIHAKGDFEDRRNVEAIGVVSAWDKYDRIVNWADEYGIQIQARISNPPRWAQVNEEAGDMAPPVNVQDYVDYAVAVAERYKGRVRYFQIWNEPNIYPEWGDLDPVNPERYTDLLCQTYTALKAVDPEIVVISGALAPTVALSERDLNDFVFLERMYAAGAGACFDVLSMQGYGLNSGPTDRRMRPTTVNVSRNVYIREMMVKHGDAHKPIWLSEAAWNSVPSEEEYPDPIDARYNFGQVSQEQAARYMPLFYDRIQREWPWVGVVNYWFFSLPDDSRKDESMYYFRLVEPDYSAEKPRFTGLPIYDALQTYLNDPAREHLYQGVHQVEGAYRIRNWQGEIINAEGAQFGKAVSTGEITFGATGTNVVIRWKGERIIVVLNGEDTVYRSDGQRWEETSLCTCVIPQDFGLQIVTPSGVDAVLFDSVTVYDDSGRNLSIAVAVIVVALLFTFGIWQVRRARP